MGHYTSVQGVIKLKPSVVKKVRKILRSFKRNYKVRLENLFAKSFRHKVFYDFAEDTRSSYLYEYKMYKNYLVISVELKNYNKTIQTYFNKVLPKLSNEYKIFYRDEDDYDEDYIEVYKIHEKNLTSLPFTIDQYYYEGNYGKISSFKFINKPSNITQETFGDI
jgi:hypothetical protein